MDNRFLKVAKDTMLFTANAIFVAPIKSAAELAVKGLTKIENKLVTKDNVIINIPKK